MRAPGSVTIDPADLRHAAAAALAAGAALPLSPWHPPVACPLRAATGMPCPLCGLTTSLGATLRLDFGTALAASPAGVAAVACALLVVLLRPRAVRIPAQLPYLVLGAMWLYQLHRFSFL